MTRHALTLIETLAATALLAIIAAACLPMLSEPMQPPTGSDAVSIDELAVLADRIMASPEESGLDLEQLLATERAAVVAAGETGSQVTLELELLRAADPEARRAWVSLRVGPTRVFRWIALPDPEEEASP